MYYLFVVVMLFALELVYFRLADRFNIIDRPNERSSHTRITLRGGGIVFYLGALVYFAASGFMYPWFMLGWYLLVALVICTGIINAYNFMDGINGITGGYSLVVLCGLVYVNTRVVSFVESDMIYTMIIGVVVFDFFNFRQKAKCFAGDVGSVGIAFIILFLLGKLILTTGDFSYIIFLVVYGVDSVLTIVHRLMLHENIGLPHRKHAYQLMANELKMPHVVVSALYMLVQGGIVAMYLALPELHYVCLVASLVLLGGGYVWFMRRYFNLHLKIG